MVATDGVLLLAPVPKSKTQRYLTIDIFLIHWQLYIKAIVLVLYFQVLELMEH
jgi:hypothetical protein